MLWIAFLLAFSPALYDLGKHWLSHAWARYSLAFVPLVLWCAYCSSPGRRLRRPGLVLVVCALLLELVAVKAAVFPLARPAVAIAALGLILMTGLMPVRTALLVLWIVPVPHVLADQLGGFATARALFAGGGAMLAGLGLDLSLDGRWILSGSQQLEIDSAYAGAPLFVALTGLGWYYALRRRLEPFHTLRCLLVFLLCGVPIQLAAVALALLALASGSARAGEVILDSGVWLLPISIGVFLAERPRRDAVRPTPG